MKPSGIIIHDMEEMWDMRKQRAKEYQNWFLKPSHILITTEGGVYNLTPKRLSRKRKKQLKKGGVKY